MPAIYDSIYSCPCGISSPSSEGKYSYELVYGGSVVVRLSMEFIEIETDDSPPITFAFACLLVYGLVCTTFICESDTNTALFVPNRSAVAT